MLHLHRGRHGRASPPGLGITLTLADAPMDPTYGGRVERLEGVVRVDELRQFPRIILLHIRYRCYDVIRIHCTKRQIPQVICTPLPPAKNAETKRKGKEKRRKRMEKPIPSPSDWCWGSSSVVSSCRNFARMRCTEYPRSSACGEPNVCDETH